MEENDQKTNLIKYLKRVLKKWYLYIGLILSVIEMISRSIGKDINISLNIVFSVYFLGFFFSNYNVYKDMVIESTKKYNDLEIESRKNYSDLLAESTKNYNELLVSIPDEYRPEEPIVNVNLVEGSSYDYSFRKINNHNDQEPKFNMFAIHDGELPCGEIKVNTRVENKSRNQVTITSICGKYNNYYDNSFYDIMLPDILLNGSKVKFPIIIESKCTQTFQLVSSMHPSNLTEAQIAVKTSKKDKLEIDFNVEVYYIYSNNEEHTNNSIFHISLRPFTKMLEDYWVSTGQNEIIKLAKSIKID